MSTFMFFDAPSFVGALPPARLDLDEWYNAEAIAPGRRSCMRVIDHDLITVPV